MERSKRLGNQENCEAVAMVEIIIREVRKD